MIERPHDQVRHEHFHRFVSWWQLNTALAAGVVSLIGIIATSLYSSSIAVLNNNLEERKFTASTIISVLKDNDPKVAVDKLIFLIDSKIIKDHDDRIRNELLDIRKPSPEQTPQPSAAPRP